MNQATWRFIPSKSMVWINADPSPPVSNWQRIRIGILARTFYGWSSTGFSFYIMFVWFVQLQHSVFHWALQLCLSTMEVCLSYRPSLAPDIRLDRQDLTKETAKDGGMFNRGKYWWYSGDFLMIFWWISEWSIFEYHSNKPSATACKSAGLYLDPHAPKENKGHMRIQKVQRLYFMTTQKQRVICSSISSGIPAAARV